MINISLRLQTVASLIPDNSYVIDVGCDHALLSIYLVQTLKHVKVIASDINPNPLKIARENIKKYNLEKKIEIREEDGIKNLNKDVDTIVIAGMGGILISKILSEKDSLKNIKRIILSPNNDYPLVRKTLNNLGFMIHTEKIILDKRKPYLVILAIPGKASNPDYFFGTLKNNSLETIYYYTNLLHTNANILKELPKKYLFKRLKLKLENKKIKKFLLTNHD